MTRPPMPLLIRGDARALPLPNACAAETYFGTQAIASKFIADVHQGVPRLYRQVAMPLKPPPLTPPNLSQPRTGSPRIEPLHLLVTGSREYTDKRTVARAVIEAVTRHYPDGIPKPFDWSSVLVRHGAAPGLDTLTRLLAEAWGMRVESIPADWANCAATCRPGHQKRRQDGVAYCPTAGLRRNTELVAKRPLADECLTFALPTSRGTFDCASKARKAAVPVYDYGVCTRFKGNPRRVC